MLMLFVIKTFSLWVIAILYIIKTVSGMCAFGTAVFFKL